MLYCLYEIADGVITCVPSMGWLHAPLLVTRQLTECLAYLPTGAAAAQDANIMSFPKFWHALGNILDGSP